MEEEVEKIITFAVIIIFKLKERVQREWLMTTGGIKKGLISHSQVLPELGGEHWGWAGVLWYSDERIRTTILSVPQIFPVLTGHTVGPRNMYENGRYAELGGKKWYHGDSPSSVGLLASLSIYIDQMTKSWNSGDDQKERAATCQGSHTGQGSPAPRPQTGAGTRPHSRRWAASEASPVFTATPHHSQHHLSSIPLRSALDSLRSANPTVNCTCERSRLHAPYENHPKIIPLQPSPWKIAFQKTGAWCQKGLGPLT